MKHTWLWPHISLSRLLEGPVGLLLPPLRLPSAFEEYTQLAHTVINFGIFYSSKTWKHARCSSCPYLYIFFVWHFKPVTTAHTHKHTHTTTQEAGRAQSDLKRSKVTACALIRKFFCRMNGESVPRLVEAFFEPMRRFLDFTFAVGVTYGVSRVVSVAWRCWRGFRVYCLPFGRCTRCDLKERFGEWAG